MQFIKVDTTREGTFPYITVVRLLAVVLLFQGVLAEELVVDTSARRIVVKLKGGGDLVAAGDYTSDYGVSASELSQVLSSVASYDQASRTAVVDADPDSDVDELIHMFTAMDTVEYAEEDVLLTIADGPVSSSSSGNNDEVSAESTSPDFKTSDPFLSAQWGLDRIIAQGAWQLTRGSSKVKVCVVDTGMDFSHPDLADNVVSQGKGWIMGRELPDSMDDNGHGTHVAGIVGAVGNNKMGVSGVSQSVSLTACKFLDKYGNGRMSDATRCLRWCDEEEGASIIVASWGGTNKWMESVASAIRSFGDKGGLFVSAALNFGSDLDRNPLYPAAFNLPNQVTVGGIDVTGSRGSYSCYGKESVHVFAPGTSIYSTLPEERYGNKTGTSMAAPMVGGALALLQAAGRCSGLECKDIIMDTVAKADKLASHCVSGGVINVATALGVSRNDDCTKNSCSKWTLPPGTTTRIGPDGEPTPVPGLGSTEPSGPKPSPDSIDSVDQDGLNDHGDEAGDAPVAAPSPVGPTAPAEAPAPTHTEASPAPAPSTSDDSAPAPVPSTEDAVPAPVPEPAEEPAAPAPVVGTPPPSPEDSSNASPEESTPDTTPTTTPDDPESQGSVPSDAAAPTGSASPTPSSVDEPISRTESQEPALAPTELVPYSVRDEGNQQQVPAGDRLTEGKGLGGSLPLPPAQAPASPPMGELPRYTFSYAVGK